MNLFQGRTTWAAAALTALLTGLAAAQDARPAAQSPKALLERGAFAEEHEGNLEAAAKLYREALEAARAAHDESTATEASAALERMDVRLGRSQGPASTQDELDPITNRIGALLAELSTLDPTRSPYGERQGDLISFGATAVPWLERALSPQPFTIGGLVVHLEPRRSAAVLARIDAPEAMAALERALSSPDPVVRKAVVSSLFSLEHRPLLEKAARDEPLRGLAVERLASLNDPGLQPAMERWAVEGHWPAMVWIAQRDPSRLLAVAADAPIAPEFRSLVLRALMDRRLAPSEKAVDTLLLWARGDHEDALRLLRQHFDQHWRGAAEVLRNRAEAIVLADLGSYPAPEVHVLLGVIGGVRSLETLARAWALASVAGAGPTPATMNAVDRLLNQPIPFERLLSLFRKLPPPGEDPSKGGLLRRLAGELASSVDEHRAEPAQLAEASSGLEGEHRAAYVNAVGEWLRMSFQRTKSSQLDPGFLPVVRELAASDQPRQRKVGAQGFGAIGDPRELGRVLDLISDPNPDISREARGSVWPLARLDPAMAARTVESKLLNSESAPGDLERNVLGLLPAKQAVELFEKLWPRRPDAESRSSLLVILVQSIMGPEATALVAKHYRDIPAEDGDLRVHALSRLARDLHEPALPLIGEELRSDDGKVRAAAHAAFQEFKKHREALAEFEAWTQTDREARASIQELVTLLASGERQVVIGAAKALGVLRARSALPALVVLLERDDPELRQAVNEAIARF